MSTAVSSPFSSLPRWRLWVLATRPKTLPLGLTAVFVGTMVAPVPLSGLSWVLLFFSALSTLAIQVGTNLINDAIDVKKGETAEGRMGPIRPTHTGQISYEATYRAGVGCLIGGVLLGVPLVLKGGVVIGAILLLSALMGYFYTGGPYPLSHTGIAEAFVLIFFGWVMVMANTYLQTEEWSFSSFVAGTQMGLLASAILAMDNLRDLFADAKGNKKTFAVRFGKTFARIEVAFCLLVPYVLNLFWWFSSFAYAALFPLFAFPLALYICRGIWSHEPGRVLNPYFACSALHHLLFGVLFIVGLRFR